MKNARAQQRWQLVTQLRVFNSLHDQLIGHLFDVSTDGIRLISEQPVEKDQDFNFYMNIHEDLPTERTCRMSARSIWSKEDISPNFYDSGFQLLDVSEETRSYLNSLIEQLKDIS
jgi:hypothetical protein